MRRSVWHWWGMCSEYEENVNKGVEFVFGRLCVINDKNGNYVLIKVK